MKRVVLVGAIAGVTLAATCLSTATAATSSSVYRPVTLVSTGGSTYTDVVVPEAADGAYAVFGRYQQSGAGVDTIGQLEAITRNGRVHVVGNTIPGLSPSSYWVEGHLLIGQKYGEQQLYWWNLARHTWGRVTLAAGHQLAGGTPTGYVYQAGTRLYSQPLRGHRRELGGNFSPYYSGPPAAVGVGPGGIVAEKSHRLFYIRYAKPRELRPLYSKLSDGKLGTDHDRWPSCSLNGTFALCSGGDQVAKESLRTGHAIRIVALRRATFALDGSSIAWLPWATGQRALSNIRVLAGRHRVKVLAVKASSITSGLGGLVAAGPVSPNRLNGAFTLGLVGPAGNERTIARRITSRAHVLRLTATNNRVYWIQEPESGPSGAFAIRSRAISATGTPVARPAASSIAVPGYDVLESTFAASGDTWLVGTLSNTAAGLDASYGSALSSSTTEPTIAPDWYSLSGHRLVYSVTGGSDMMVTDLDTGTTESLGIPKASLASISLWGPYLAYTTSDGGVYRLDLDTNHLDTIIPTAIIGDSALIATEYGDEIALSCGGDNPYEHCRKVEVINLATNTDTTIALPWRTVFVGLTDRGVESEFIPLAETKSEAFYLSPYGSTSVKPFAAADLFGTAPVVTSDLATWIDPHGQIVVQRLAHVANRPESLGDPTAPAAYTTGTGRSWRADIAYSAPLTSCIVEILDGSTVVHALACNPTDAAEGNAVVAWDGTGSSGTVSPGTYGWRAVVSNADGAEIGGASTGAIVVS